MVVNMKTKKEIKEMLTDKHFHTKPMEDLIKLNVQSYEEGFRDALKWVLQ